MKYEVKHEYIFILENYISLAEDIPLDDKLRQKARLTLQRTKWTLQESLKLNRGKLAKEMSKKPKNAKDENERFDRLCRHGYLRGIIDGLKESIYEIQKQTDDLNAGFYDIDIDVETNRLEKLNKQEGITK